jgi:hypothetical protein
MVRITSETDLAGRKGIDLKLRDFPVVIGRGARAGVRLEDAGIWEEHAELQFEAGEGFVARSCGEALLVVNGRAAPKARLRNGDLIELGEARLRFGFSEAKQRGFRLRERAHWVAIALLCLVQLVLVYFVLP